MCGIAGIIDFKNQIITSERETYVQEMGQAILHRGPDEAGHFTNEQCTLFMRRLSIIDLSGGQQPVFNETGEIGVFFNGEIYNYLELKLYLEKKGHQFSTQSDTEVLVHLYEEYGEKMLPHLHGMFAFCIFDKKQNKYFLARDRFGEKPLFYHFAQGVFSFSSEVKSLLQNKTIPRLLNKTALPYYFRTSLLPEPMTFFQGIFCLPAGHFIRLDKTGLQLDKYFEIHYAPDTNIKTEEDAIAYIRPVLEDAVKKQTVSDVPIGAFLSGGIDSSSIVALLQKNTNQAINTFTARFEEQDYDESNIAKKVAQYCGTHHHEIVIPNYDFTEDIFWKIIEHVGQPFRDSSAIPSYLLTREIGKEVKVALSGDGGDELFGGYDLFQWYLKIIQLKKIPKVIRQLGNWSLMTTSRLPFLEDVNKLRQIQRAVKTSLAANEDVPIALNSFFSLIEIEDLLQKKNPLSLAKLQYIPQAIKDTSTLRTIMYYRTQHTLPANMLVKVDRMSMANSLEVRAPFLDPDLFAAAAKLPDKFLIKHGKGKYLIRQMMKNELPNEVFNHPKSGFNIPLHKYQNQIYQSLAKRLLFEENPLPELFDSGQLQQIYQQGINGVKGQSIFQTSHKLWMLMQFLGWAKKFEVQLA